MQPIRHPRTSLPATPSPVRAATVRERRAPIELGSTLRNIRGYTRLALLLIVQCCSAVQLTPPAAGPYHVRGNRIIDAAGHPYLARGTDLPTLTLDPSDLAGDGHQFGPFSPSSLVSI